MAIRTWRDREERREAVGRRHGFRSGLDTANARHLEALGVPVLFEKLKVRYAVPASMHIYTPDFELPNGIIVETKGLLERKDRVKHILVQAQHPALDIRFVFQNPSASIYKGSPTTYREWAEKHGFRWAAKVIPEAWVREPGPAKKPSEVLQRKGG